MTLRIGQKVICVDASNFRNPDLLYLSNGKAPVLGRIYTIRGFTPSGNLKLVEIVGRRHLWIDGVYEGGWLARRFRPVVERKTDISIFTEMLNVKPAKAHALTSQHETKGGS